MKKYTALTDIKHNGKLYIPDSTIELEDEDAKALLNLKAAEESKEIPYKDKTAKEQIEYASQIKDKSELEKLMQISKSHAKKYITKIIRELE